MCVGEKFKIYRYFFDFLAQKLQNFQNQSEKLGQAADEMLKISVISDPNHRQIFENAAKKLKNAQENIAYFADLAKDDYDFDNSQVHKKFDENWNIRSKIKMNFWQIFGVRVKKIFARYLACSKILEVG